MAYLTIHRGTNEIGGNAIEIGNNKTKLLFDFGIPLESMDRKDYNIEEYKLAIKGLYKDEKLKFKAVFLTHAHLDHFGLIELINSEIPVYVSKTTFDILTKINSLLSAKDMSKLNLNIVEDEIDFGNIKVKAYDVDHSVAGACAYEIIMGNKRIVYTGDIRFHGRAAYKSSLFKRAINNPDYMIMEGTTLGRAEQDKIGEKDLENKFIEIFKMNKLPLVQFSPQNLDRLVTVYRACLQTGKTLVIDPYTAFVLEVYSSLSPNIPQYDWENIMVNFASCRINNKLAESKTLYKYKDKKITLEEIVNNSEKYVVKGNWSLNNQIFGKINKSDLNIVFSMWKGYLDKPGQFDNYKDILTVIHTSGHAYIEDLQDFIAKTQPKNLIPVHTECKTKYAELFKATNVIELNDGEKLKI